MYVNANLSNDLVRDMNTTIKFDRVSSTSRVVDWTALTSYVFNDLLRYKNQLYTKQQILLHQQQNLMIILETCTRYMVMKQD